MTLTEWAITSWSSRAIRLRSSATAARASVPRVPLEPDGPLLERRRRAGRAAAARRRRGDESARRGAATPACRASMRTSRCAMTAMLADADRRRRREPRCRSLWAPTTQNVRGARRSPSTPLPTRRRRTTGAPASAKAKAGAANGKRCRRAAAASRGARTGTRTSFGPGTDATQISISDDDGEGDDERVEHVRSDAPTVSRRSTPAPARALRRTARTRRPARPPRAGAGRARRSRPRHAAGPRARLRTGRRARACRRGRRCRGRPSRTTGVPSFAISSSSAPCPYRSGHARARGAGVLARVRQRLLDDPVGGEVDSRRQRRAAARPPPRARPARPAARVCSRSSRQRGQARLRRERRLALLAAQDPEQAAHLAERLPARLLDRAAAARARARAPRRGARRAAPAWTVMTLTQWAITSWRSRAIRRSLLGDRGAGAPPRARARDGRPAASSATARRARRCRA